VAEKHYQTRFGGKLPAPPPAHWLELGGGKRGVGARPPIAYNKAAMYKEIQLTRTKSLSKKEINLIDSFNRHFHKRDFHIVPEGNTVQILLREVDMEHLKKSVEELSAGNGLLADILAAVENVGSYGIRGKKRDYVNYNKERKVKDRAAKELRRGKFYYAKDHGHSTRNSDAPARYVNKIICGDSGTVLKKLPDNCVDLIFTSPPYNFGLDYASGADDFDWPGYFDKLFAVFDQCVRVLKHGGRIVVNIQPLYSDYIPSHHVISNYFINKKLIWKGEILWEKNNYNCKYTAWGSWKSPSNPYLKYTWEFIEIFCKGDLKKPGDRDCIDISADEFKKWVIGKWSVAPERRMKEYGHPAMFPENLADRALRLFSFQGDLVLDPFNGAGTTTLVAKKTGRRYLGIDISSDYCKSAEERMSRVLL